MALNITLLLLLLLPKSHVCFPEEKKCVIIILTRFPGLAYTNIMQIKILPMHLHKKSTYCSVFFPAIFYIQKKPFLFLGQRPGIHCVVHKNELSWLFLWNQVLRVRVFNFHWSSWYIYVYILFGMFSTNKHEASSSQAFSTTQNKFSKRKYASKSEIHNKVTLNWFAQRKKSQNILHTFILFRSKNFEHMHTCALYWCWWRWCVLWKLQKFSFPILSSKTKHEGTTLE